MKLQGRKISSGKAEGEILYCKDPISFYGGVDPENGVVAEKGHCLEGKSIAGKVLVFPQGKGSTVGSYAIYRLKKAGKAPIAMINKECETIVAVGAIISEIPCVDHIEIEKLKDKASVIVDADNGTVELK